MLSTPVWGVELKNEAVAPLLAPLLRIDAATGITEQEHKGIGIPIIVALRTLLWLCFPNCLRTNIGLISHWSSPATKNPAIR